MDLRFKAHRTGFMPRILNSFWAASDGMFLLLSLASGQFLSVRSLIEGLGFRVVGLSRIVELRSPKPQKTCCIPQTHAQT